VDAYVYDICFIYIYIYIYIYIHIYICIYIYIYIYNFSAVVLARPNNNTLFQYFDFEDLHSAHRFITYMPMHHLLLIALPIHPPPPPTHPPNHLVTIACCCEYLYRWIVRACSSILLLCVRMELVGLDIQANPASKRAKKKQSQNELPCLFSYSLRTRVAPSLFLFIGVVGI
jgi:hypothetical protein